MNKWVFDLVSENIGIAKSVRVPERNAFLDSLEDEICGFWFIEKICTVSLVLLPYAKEFIMNTLRGY